MLAGNQKNPLHHRSDDEENSPIANAKKPRPADPNQEPNQQHGADGATTLNATDGAGPSTGTKNSGFSYNNKIGMKAMKAAQTNTARKEPEELDESMEPESEWVEVPRSKEHNFTVTTFMGHLHGTTIAEKKRELQDLLLTRKVHCTEGPFKSKDAHGHPGFRLTVETQEDLDKLLEVTIEGEDQEGNKHVTHLFTRYDNTLRQTEQQRSIEIYGLHPRIDEFRITSAMSQFGEVEKINTRICRNGVKMSARVTFQEEGIIEKIAKEGRKWVFIGRDLARLSMVGSERLNWELKYVAKLSQLPMGTTALDLQSLLEEKKAEFIIIPKIISRDGKRTRNLREAFVYFSSEEDMKSNMEKPVRVGGYDTHWGSTEEKRCRECGQLGHIQRQCPVFEERLKTKEHIRAVKEYQKGGALKVTKQISFAQMAKNDNQSNNQESRPSGQSQADTDAKQTQEKQTQETHSQEKQEHKAHGQHMGKMDKQITELQRTIVRMQEEQQKMAQTNQVLMTILLQVITQQNGITLPKELLAAAGLSTEVHRNLPKGKKDAAGVSASIPPTNESLAGLLGLLSAPKTATGSSSGLPSRPSK